MTALRLKLLVAGVVGCCSAIAPSLPSPANNVICEGILGATSIDHLRVPEGVTCNLNGTQVNGNIFVEAEATLVARAVRVEGDIQAENAAQVTVMGRSKVRGSIHIKQSRGATVLNSCIDGHVQFEGNSQPLNSEGNTIGGNLHAIRNRGGVRIFANRIGGNLQCKDNRPTPTGNGNIVRGIKADQCDRF